MPVRINVKQSNEMCRLSTARPNGNILSIVIYAKLAWHSIVGDDGGSSGLPSNAKLCIRFYLLKIRI